MITRQELELHARGIEERARASRMESPRDGESTLAVTAASVPLFTFPDSSLRLKASPVQAEQTRQFRRWVDVVEGPAGPRYRLMEAETAADSAGRTVWQFDSVAVVTEDTAWETVSAGYRRIDEDRLTEQVEPIVDHVRVHGCTTAEWDDAVSRIQHVAAGLDLTPASQLRVKSDAIDLIEGRLDVGDFVARTVARQECFQITQRIRHSAALTESIDV